MRYDPDLVRPMRVELTSLGFQELLTPEDVDGFMAVLLWREYRRGNRAALDTLIRYNLEDVVNLRYLADQVYNLHLARLPLSLESLPEPEKYPLDDLPYDEELVEYFRRQVEEHRWYR